MGTQIIPINADPNQTAQFTAFIDGHNKSFKIRLRFNERAGYWAMTIVDPATDTVILDSVPLVPDVAPDPNTLSQFAYLGVGSVALVNVSGTPDDPNETNLGKDYVLVWGDTPSA